MELHFGDKPLKVPAPNVPAKLSDGSDSDQETVNDALFEALKQVKERIENIESEGGFVYWPLVGSDGEMYEKADCHQFTSYATTGIPELPTKVDPVLVLVNGIRRDSIRGVTNLDEGDEILAVFDYDNSLGSDLSWVKSIDQIGLNRNTGQRNQVASMHSMMMFMLDDQPVVAQMDTSHLTDWSYFAADSQFDQPINHWNSDNVTDFSHMFTRSAFNQPIGDWDVSEGQQFDGMFLDAASFNQNLTTWCSVSHQSSNRFDEGATAWAPGNKHVPGTCPVLPESFYHIIWSRSAETWSTMPTSDLETDPYRTLVNTGESFTGIDGNTYTKFKWIGNWDNSAKNRSMTGYGRLEQIGRDWTHGKRNTVSNGGKAFRNLRTDRDPVRVSEMARMLEKMDVSHLDDMSQMLEGCSEIGDIDLTGWDVSNVTTMYRLFYNCTKMNPDMTGWDVSNVESFADIAYGTKEGFTGIGMEGWNPASVNDISRMFYNATKFIADLSDWDVSKCTSMSRVFYNVDHVNGDYGKWDVRNVTTFEFMFSYTGGFSKPINLYPWRNQLINPNTTLWGMFQNTYDSEGGEVPQGMADWDITNVISTRSTFWNCYYVPDIRSWDTSNVNNMESMFQGSNFDLDISHWDTSKVTTMRQMFKDNVDFNIDLSGWCVSLIAPGSSGATDFALGATSYVLPKPVWGTCP